MKISNHKKTGFTLVEMMVAVFVFSVVMVLSTGAIFSIVSANKTSQALKSVMDNLSSALDSMSRDIRYGTVYHCGGTSWDFITPASCDGNGNTGGTVFAFVDKDNQYVIYNFNVVAQSIEKCSGSVSVCTRLTAPEVHITDLHFYVQGSTKVESQQPQLLMTVSGYAQAGANQSKFNIETMVSQRSLMCKQSMIDKLLCQ